MPLEGLFRPDLAFEKVFDYPEEYIFAKPPAQFRLRVERQLYRAAVFFGEEGAVWDVFVGWSKRPYTPEEQRQQELKKTLVLEYAVTRYLQRNAPLKAGPAGADAAALEALLEKIRAVRKGLEAPLPQAPATAKVAPPPKPAAPGKPPALKPDQG